MTEYAIAISMALSFLESSDAINRVYFIDTITSNYCRYCGEKIIKWEGCECQND